MKAVRGRGGSQCALASGDRVRQCAIGAGGAAAAAR